MELDNFISKKNEKLGKKRQKAFLKVNKYDDPKNAMELIGHICTAAKDIDFTDEFTPIKKLLDELEDERKEKNFVWNDNLYDNISNILQTLEQSYLDNTYQLKIAVSGGYSAGKSTFMNKLIGNDEFLPTDMNPTSLVNTYINFNRDIKKPIVRGENIKNDLVLLDEDVLASIRHDTQNAKAISNVLRRLIIDVPSKDYLDGITFIDTPGYDNSLSVNRENGTTDKDTAEKAFKDANVIIWCANIGKQITHEDLTFIRENGGDEKPVVVLLSRMNSKTRKETGEIVKECHNTVEKELKNVLDVIAFDRDNLLDDICSCKRNSFSQLFLKIKEEHGTTIKELCSSFISKYFDEEDKISKDWQVELKKEYNNTIKELNKARKNKSSLKEKKKDWISELRSILIDGYNDMLQNAKNCAKSSSNAIKAFEKFIDDLDSFIGKKRRSWLPPTGLLNDLDKIISKAKNKLQKAKNEHDEAIDYEYYEEESRNVIFDDFKADVLVDNDPDVKDYENDKKELSDNIQNEVVCQQSIKKYKPLILNCLNELDKACIAKRQKYYKSLEKLDNSEEKDIFAAISGNDMSRFILCFHTGVELSSCNEQGYNILTWIAINGNSSMADFLIRHKDDDSGIDLTIKDNNGYNIMDASVVAHNKELYTLLKKNVPSLRLTNERAHSLSAKNDFNAWLNNNL